MGSRCGCGPDPGAPRPRRTEWAQPPARGEENEGRRWPRAPGEEGCGERELWSGRPGRDVQRCRPPLRDGRRPATPPARSARLPGGRGCGQRGAHTRAHSARACSVRPWELPAQSRAARPPPRPGLAKLGAEGARVGVRPPPGAHWCPRPRPLPCLTLPDPEASVAGSLQDWERRRRGCHFPLSEARSEAGWPQAWRCGRLRGVLLAVRLPSARAPRGSRLGGRGCAGAGTAAHTLAVTHKAVVS